LDCACGNRRLRSNCFARGGHLADGLDRLYNAFGLNAALRGLRFSAAALGFHGLLHALPGLLAHLSAGRGKVPVFGATKIGPGIKCRYIIRSLIGHGKRFASHISPSTFTSRRPTARMKKFCRLPVYRSGVPEHFSVRFCTQSP
jgi:hypothetical protein